MGVVLAFSLSGLMGLIGPEPLALIWEKVIENFQIWRLLSNFFFIPLSARTLMTFIFYMTILGRYAVDLEKEHFAAGPRGRADFLFFLTFCGVILTIISFFHGRLYFLSFSLLFSVLHVWSRKDPYGAAGFWGFRFARWQLPFAYLVFFLVLEQDVFSLIFGVLTGHLYHFLVDVVPRVYGVDILITPSFLLKYFEAGGNIQFSSTPAWLRGQGNRLG